MDIVNHASLDPSELAKIENAVAAQQNLQDVMAWAWSHPAGVFMPSVVAEVVVQDEFTHDVVVPFRDGLVLVYDTT